MASIEPQPSGIVRVLCTDPESPPELERALAERFGAGIDWRMRAALDYELNAVLRKTTPRVKMTR
jgi:hypothetical protein